MTRPRRKISQHAVALLGATVLVGCSGNFDMDLRGALGGGLDTSEAAQNASVAARPAPDARGVITYADYQVAVAEPGDTVTTVAARIGLPADELAHHNGLEPDAMLRGGEVIALPRPVAVSDFGPQQGTPLNPTIVDVTEIVPEGTAAQPRGTDPVTHRVEPGETAFSISRLYNVPVAALQSWNGLDSDLSLREGQLLTIPVVTPGVVGGVSAPGQGSLTPVPPSATRPQPQDLSIPTPAVPGTATSSTQPPAPLGPTTSASAEPERAMVRPVAGSIIRGYTKGRNEGIDIGAPAATTVRAADAGTVAAISTDTNGVNLLVIQHADGLLTVYTNIDTLTVVKGDAIRRGQDIAKVAPGDPSFLHFEVRRGLESLDPEEFI